MKWKKLVLFALAGILVLAGWGPGGAAYALVPGTTLTPKIPPQTTIPHSPLSSVNVQILEPADGAIIQAQPHPAGGCEAEIRLKISVSATAAVERVHFTGTRLQPAPVLDVHNYDLCGPGDPIEQRDPSCPRGSSFTLEKDLRLPAGEWRLTATAYTGSGSRGSATVTIVVREPGGPRPGPVVLTQVTPNHGSPPIPLRDDGLKTAADVVVIKGQNLHNNPFLEVYLSPLGVAPDPTFLPEGGLPIINWELIPAEIVGKGTADGQSFLRVRIPGVAMQKEYFQNNYQWRWIVRDRWIRPERVGPGDDEYKVLPDPYKPTGSRGPAFRLVMPPYPFVDGFGYKNFGHDASFNEFLTVFGDSAYVGWGPFKVPDPFYWGIWWPSYRHWINNTHGSCVGMAATSQLMRLGVLKPQDFDPHVRFPAGFQNAGNPADYDCPSVTCPAVVAPKPGDLWAYIRLNLGVQTSAEYLSEAIADLEGGLFSIEGDPVARLEEIRTNPTNYVISMIPEISKGHAVTPYAVENLSPTVSRIWVYDNNAPGQKRWIDIDRSTNTYEFPRTDGAVWRGKGIFAIPLSIWQGQRTMPGLDELGDFLWVLIVGDADGMYSTAAGGRWG